MKWQVSGSKGVFGDLKMYARIQRDISWRGKSINELNKEELIVYLQVS